MFVCFLFFVDTFIEGQIRISFGIQLFDLEKVDDEIHSSLNVEWLQPAFNSTASHEQEH